MDEFILAEVHGPTVLAEFVRSLHQSREVPQCEARTNRGERCKNPVFDGQMWTWCRGCDQPLMTEEGWATIASGFCRVHRGAR